MSQTKTTKRVPILVRILNIVDQYYFSCSAGTRKDFLELSLSLCFTFIISGAILAASLAEFVFKSYHYFGLLFVICAFFYYLIDKALVFSKKTNKMLIIIRLSLALIFCLFNSFLIDTFWFQDDIEAAWISEHHALINEQKEKYTDQSDGLHAQKATLLKDIDQLYYALKIKREKLDGEVDGSKGSGSVGKGPIYEAKLRSYLSDSLSNATLINKKEEEIKKLEIRLLNAESSLQATINQKPNFKNLGINKRMELLHNTIWINGNFTTILTSILILLASIALELVPLLYKQNTDITEYHIIASNDRNLALSKSAIKNETAIKLSSLQELNDFQSKQQEAIYIANISKLTALKQYYKDIFAEEEQALDNLDALAKELESKFPNYFEQHVNPLLEEALKELKAVTKKAISV